MGRPALVTRDSAFQRNWFSYEVFDREGRPGSIGYRREGLYTQRAENGGSTDAGELLGREAVRTVRCGVRDHPFHCRSNRLEIPHHH